MHVIHHSAAFFELSLNILLITVAQKTAPMFAHLSMIALV